MAPLTSSPLTVEQFNALFRGTTPLPPAVMPAALPAPPCKLAPHVAAQLPADVADHLRTGYPWHSAARRKACQKELGALETWVRAKATRQITFSRTRVLDILAEDLAETAQALIEERTGYWDQVIVYPKRPIPTRFQWEIKTSRGWKSRTRRYWQFFTLDRYHKPVPRQAARALQLTAALPIPPEQVWVSDLKEQTEPAPPLIDFGKVLDALDAVGRQTIALTDPVLWVSFGGLLVPIAMWE